jgi:hypothetical protein
VSFHGDFAISPEDINGLKYVFLDILDQLFDWPAEDISVERSKGPMVLRQSLNPVRTLPLLELAAL